MTEAKYIIMNKEGWVVCGKCGHKLFKSTGGGMVSGIEIKCHSCKELNTTDLTWIFTFGLGREHGGHYVKFTGTYGEARDKMIAKYGDQWAFQYSMEEWQESLDKGYELETELVE